MAERIIFKNGSGGKDYWNKLEGYLESRYGNLKRHETIQILSNNKEEILENLPENKEDAKK